MIIRRTRKEIDGTPVFIWNRSFRRREFNFVNRFKGDVEPNRERVKDFETDGRKISKTTRLRQGSE